MKFFVGLHQPHDAVHFRRAFISVSRLRERKSDFDARDWILDSGAFSELVRFGKYRDGVEAYAAQVERWSRCGRLLAAVAQDYMCEPFVLARTRLTIADHQLLTLRRYIALRRHVRSTLVIPVLQGYEAEEYVEHIKLYGQHLGPGAWVGVGSVCKRNRSPDAVRKVLAAIRHQRPDLRLHGFGLKLTALSQPSIRDMLYSADSMAWSFHARKQGRSPNDWHEAQLFVRRVGSVRRTLRHLNSQHVSARQQTALPPLI